MRRSYSLPIAGIPSKVYRDFVLIPICPFADSFVFDPEDLPLLTRIASFRVYSHRPLFAIQTAFSTSLLPSSPFTSWLMMCSDRLIFNRRLIHINGNKHDYRRGNVRVSSPSSSVLRSHRRAENKVLPAIVVPRLPPPLIPVSSRSEISEASYLDTFRRRFPFKETPTDLRLIETALALPAPDEGWPVPACPDPRPRPMFGVCPPPQYPSTRTPRRRKSDRPAETHIPTADPLPPAAPAVILPEDGKPCDHPGCLSHLTHPCEGCGRIGGMMAPPTEEVTL